MEETENDGSKTVTTALGVPIKVGKAPDYLGEGAILQVATAAHSPATWSRVYVDRLAVLELIRELMRISVGSEERTVSEEVAVSEEKTSSVQRTQKVVSPSHTVSLSNLEADGVVMGVIIEIASVSDPSGDSFTAQMPLGVLEEAVRDYQAGMPVNEYLENALFRWHNAPKDDVMQALGAYFEDAS